MVLLQFLWMTLWLHPMHVSVTEIEYDEKDKALEIMMRVFIDDFENTLRQSLSEPELDILQPKKGKTTDDLTREYLSGRFSIKLDNKAQKVTYLGHEREGEAFIFYLEVENVRKWETIQVRNSIITELFDDQSNLVHVSVQDVVRSLRLTRHTPEGKLSFPR